MMQVYRLMIYFQVLLRCSLHTIYDDIYLIHIGQSVDIGLSLSFLHSRVCLTYHPIKSLWMAIIGTCLDLTPAPVSLIDRQH